MPRNRTNQSDNDDNELTNIIEYSQCVYDILQIIKTITDKPGIYKELDSIYFRLFNKLKKIIRTSDFKLKNTNYFLPEDLIYLPYRSESDKNVFNKAEKNLYFILHNIENKRREILDDKYNPQTGIVDEELIEILNNIYGRKEYISYKTKIKEQNHNVIEVSEYIKERYPGISLKYENGKGYFKFKRNDEPVFLGGYNTRVCKMVHYICENSGKIKKIDDVFSSIKISRDNKNIELLQNNPRSNKIKKDKIISTIKELQKEKYLKGYIKTPEFDDNNKTVKIEFV